MAKTAKELLTDAKLDKTYWGKKIIAAEKRGEFTKRDIDLSREWQTCACGKQDPRIPRHAKNNGWATPGCPIDDTLEILGVEFCGDCEQHQPADAARTLIKIERRAARVLAEVLAKEAAVAEASK